VRGADQAGAHDGTARSAAGGADMALTEKPEVVRDNRQTERDEERFADRTSRLAILP
jgi:hypothetical protein